MVKPLMVPVKYKCANLNMIRSSLASLKSHHFPSAQNYGGGGGGGISMNKVAQKL